jgi:hypothetical protein
LEAGTAVAVFGREVVLLPLVAVVAVDTVGLVSVLLIDTEVLGGVA